MLHKMHNFMKMTALGTVSSSKGLKVGKQLSICIQRRSSYLYFQATEKIIKYLEKVDAPPEDEPEEEESGDFTLFNVSFPSSHMISNFSVISHSATLTTLKPSQSMLSISTYPNFNFPIAGVDRRHNLIERRTKCGRSDKLLF